MINLILYQLIYGKNTENYFPYFYKLLNDINFDLSKIKYLKYFESNRWDIFLKDGNLIKLSSDKSEAKESLANFIAIYSDKKFEQYKIFDFRVKSINTKVIDIMEEKLIIELDDNKIKYGVFGINENNQYQLLSKKISENAGIKKGKVLDFEYSTKIISKDLDEIEKEVNKVFKSISVVLNQKDVFCTNLCGFKKLNGSKVEKRDLDYILNEAKNSISSNQKNNSILHILNSNFILDKTKQDKVPLNIFGDHLSLHMTFVSIPDNNLKNIKEIFNKSDLKIDRIISKPLAGKYQSVKCRQKSKNFVSINFGNELTTISICQNSSLIF